MERSNASKLFEDLREGRITFAAFIDKISELPKAEQDQLLAVKSKHENAKKGNA
jgi:hypothetical protein